MEGFYMKNINEALRSLDYWLGIKDCCCNSPTPIGGCLKCDLEQIRGVLQSLKPEESFQQEYLCYPYEQQEKIRFERKLGSASGDVHWGLNSEGIKVCSIVYDRLDKEYILYFYHTDYTHIFPFGEYLLSDVKKEAQRYYDCLDGEYA